MLVSFQTGGWDSSTQSLHVMLSWSLAGIVRSSSQIYTSDQPPAQRTYV